MLERSSRRGSLLDIMLLHLPNHALPMHDAGSTSGVYCAVSGDQANTSSLPQQIYSIISFCSHIPSSNSRDIFQEKTSFSENSYRIVGSCYSSLPLPMLDYAILGRKTSERNDRLNYSDIGCDTVRIAFPAVYAQVKLCKQSRSSQTGVRFQSLSLNPGARQFHIDDSARSIIDKINNLTNLKVTYLSRGWCCVFNALCQIRHSVCDSYLAVADGGELLTRDVIDYDRPRQDTGAYLGTMDVVKYRPNDTEDNLDFRVSTIETLQIQVRDMTVQRNHNAGEIPRQEAVCLCSRFQYMDTYPEPLARRSWPCTGSAILSWTYRRDYAPQTDIDMKDQEIDRLKNASARSNDQFQRRQSLAGKRKRSREAGASQGCFRE
nr:hypothetical protein CFP56_09155 [Quercus suber]